MRLLDLSPERVLAVYAHPDDAEVSCGGALAVWAEKGAQVHVLVVARGEKGTADPDADRAELASTRAAESDAAGAVLGVCAHHRLDQPDGTIADGDALRAAIVEVVRAVQPALVVAPDPTAVMFGDRYVNHPDHRAVGWATLAAVPHAAGNPHYYPEHGASWAPSTLLLSGTLEPDAAVDISGTLEAKVAALACHRSQLGQAGEYLRTVVVQRAEDAGRDAGVTHAEAFRLVVLGA